MTNYLGQQFGNYRLIKLLGEGGFAEVYLGEHIHLGTFSAVKVLTTKLTEGEIEQFRNEARTMMRLKHPHILRILDFGLVGRVPFIVMEYIPRGSLRKIHPKGHVLPLSEVVGYVKQISAALQYVHDQKLIHRDVKPENILLENQNEILLSDFGITVAAHNTHSLKTQDTSGTIYYMAPEQIQGKPRPSSDQYSLAIMVYEWLCGTRPFNGTYWEIVTQHMSTPPPSLRQRISTLPSVVEHILLKALAKDHTQRFPNVQAFSEALEEASTKPPVGTKLSTHHSITGFVCAIAWSPDSHMIASGNVTTSMVQVWEPLKRNTLLASHQGLGKCAIWSPNGKYIVFGDDGNTQRNDDLGDAFLAIAASHIWNPLSNETISVHTSPALGGLCLDVAWSPDGSHVAMAGSYAHTEGFIEVWNVFSGKTVFSSEQFHGHISSLAWLHDGVHLVSAGEDTKVHIWNVRNGKPILTYGGHSSPVNDVALSLDNHYAASASTDGTVHVWDAATGQSILIYSGHTERVNSITWSPDSSLIASGSWDKTVHIWDVSNGNRVFSYSGHTGSVMAVAWSPNGELIASAGQDQTVQIWQAP